MEATSFDVVQMRMNASQQRWLQDLYESISMTKFNNLKVKRTYCEQTEMVFERDIPSCSTREVLIRYLRRALIDIIQRVQNGIDSDGISSRLENLIGLLLRSAHLYQDGGQVLAVLRTALTAVEIAVNLRMIPHMVGSS